MPYRDVLERLYVLDPLPGWKPTRNHIARLTEPSKHHLADPALATALLGLTPQSLLAGDEPAGAALHRQRPRRHPSPLLREQLGADLLDAVVITSGTEAYRRPDGIAVVPAALLGP